MHQGWGPDHALVLVDDQTLTPWDFISSDTMTTVRDIPVANATLDQFYAITSSRQTDLIEAAIEALPDDTIAHRLGDFVCTYHGIDLNAADPGLWLVILSPDPDSGGYATFGPPGSGLIVVGRADGTAKPIPQRRFAADLAKQNVLRAAEGLPALPDPAKVTHDAPAVAGANTDESQGDSNPSQEDQP